MEFGVEMRELMEQIDEPGWLMGGIIANRVLARPMAQQHRQKPYLQFISQFNSSRRSFNLVGFFLFLRRDNHPELGTLEVFPRGMKVMSSVLIEFITITSMSVVMGRS